MSGFPVADLSLVGPEDRRSLKSQHFAKLSFAQNSNSEFLGFVQLAPGGITRQQVVSLLADVAADFSAARNDQFSNFLARLAQSSGYDPGCAGDRRIRRLFFRLDLRLHSKLLQPFDHLTISWFLKKIV